MGEAVTSVATFEASRRELLKLLEVSEYAQGKNNALTPTEMPFDIEADGQSFAHMLYDLRVTDGDLVESYSDSEEQEWRVAISFLYRVRSGQTREDVDLATTLAHAIQSALLGERCSPWRTEGPPLRTWVGVDTNAGHRWLRVDLGFLARVIWTPPTQTEIQS